MPTPKEVQKMLHDQIKSLGDKLDRVLELLEKKETVKKGKKK